MRAAVALLCVLLAGTGPGMAQDADGTDVAAGEAYYYDFCAACHGDDATGGGPMTEILNADPPDLTRLSARNGGTFPLARVIFRIDGRDPVLAHGGPMPIFGDIFGDELVATRSEAGQPILAARGIVEIAAWLQSIQR